MSSKCKWPKDAPVFEVLTSHGKDFCVSEGPDDRVNELLWIRFADGNLILSCGPFIPQTPAAREVLDYLYDGEDRVPPAWMWANWEDFHPRKRLR